MRKGIRRLALSLFFIMALGLSLEAQTIYLQEGFEAGRKPDGWTENMVTGEIPWRYRNGGYNPSDPNLLKPAAEYDMFRNPDSPKTGTFNSWFFTQGFGREQTKLITPPLNLQFAVVPTLTFSLTLHEWRLPTAVNNDILRVYYRIGLKGGWNLLQTYNFVQNKWLDFQITLPDACKTKDVYIAFEGLSRWGMGVCLDDIKIEETGSMAKQLTEVMPQPVTQDFVPNGTNNNPILCTRLKIIGNQGKATLNNVKVDALATALPDISKVTLYLTSEPTFNTTTPVGNGTLGGSSVSIPTSFELNTGYSYLWVAYDIVAGAKSGNYIDASIPTNGIDVNGVKAPNAAVNSPGTRIIKQNLFFDDFETNRGWILNGDFEINAPLGKGGAFGNPDPTYATSGTKVLGNDLSNNGIYDPNIPSSAPYTATSPSFDAMFYKGLVLNYQRWLNVDLYDTVKIQASLDNGVTWKTLWANNDYSLDDSWRSHAVNFPSEFDRANNIKLRYTLSYTNSDREFTGWNIDDVSVIGNFMEKDLSITQILSPQSTCGSSTSTIPIIIKVKNAGSKKAVAPIPVKISFGTTTISDNITQDIDPGTEKTITLTKQFPADLYGNFHIIAQSLLPDDEDLTNDTTSTKVYISRTFPLPYSNNFDTADDWISIGKEWEHGTSTAAGILGEAAGDKMWITSLNGNYANSSVSYLTSPCFEIAGLEKPMLDFRTSYNLEDGKDGVSMSYSIDNGATWTPVGTNGDGWDALWGWADQKAIAASSKVGFTGNSGGWKTINHLLPNHLNGLSGVRFRFEFASDAQNNNFAGFGLNSFTIKEAPDDFGPGKVTYPVQLDGSNACEGFTDKEFIVFTIKNKGIKTAKAGTVVKVEFESSYTLPAGTTPSRTEKFEESFTLPNDLMVNGEATFTATTPIDMNRGGKYAITVKTVDSPINFYNTNNDLLKVDIVVRKPVVDLGPTTYLLNPTSTAKLFDITDFAATYDIKWEKRIGNGAWQIDGAGGITRSVSITDFVAPNNKISYKVTLTEMPSGCNASSISDVYKLNPDIKMHRIVSPIDTCSLKKDQTVTIRLLNNGLEIDTIKKNTILDLRLTAKGKTYPGVKFTVPRDIAPGDSIDYTFADKIDMSQVGVAYNVAATVSMQYDVNTLNDRIEKNISAFGYPNFTLTPQDNVVNGTEFTYDAGTGYKEYLWYDATKNQTNTVLFPGPADKKITCKVTDNNGCSTKSEGTITFAFKDINLVSIDNLATGCTQPKDLRPMLTVKNLGTLDIADKTVLQVSVDVNGTKHTESYTITPALPAGQSRSISLNTPINIASKGTYTVTISATMPDDAVTTNNEVRQSVETYGLPVLNLPPKVSSRLSEVTLDAGAGFVDYFWSNNDITQTTIVTKDGEYIVRVTDGKGCSNKDTTNVVFIRNDISATLVSSFAADGNLCTDGKKEYPLTIKIKNVGNDTLKTGFKLPATYKNGLSQLKEDIVFDKDFLPNSELDYTFTKPIIFTAAGETSVSAFITLDDINLLNNYTDPQKYTVRQTPTFNLPQDQTPTGADYQIIPTITLPTPGSAEHTGLKYLWSTAEVTPSIIVNQSNQYILTINNGKCAASDTINVLFNRVDLSIDAIQSPSSYCHSADSKAVTFTFRNSGLTDIEAGKTVEFTYTIDGQTSTETLVLDVPLKVKEVRSYTFTKLITPLAAGDKTLSVSLKYAEDGIAANNKKDQLFAVHALPVVALDNPIISSASSVEIKGPAGYTTYYWSTGATTQNITVTKSGTYTLNVTNDKGCMGTGSTVVTFKTDLELTTIESMGACKDAQNQALTVKVTNISGNEAPKGATLKFTATFNSGAPVKQDIVLDAALLPGASKIIPLTSILIPNATLGAVATTVSFTYDGEENAANNSKTATITVNPVPVFTLPAEVTSSKPSEVLTGPADQHDYLWSTGEKTPTITVNKSGTYTLTVTNSLGCSHSASTNVTFSNDIELTSVDNGSSCQNTGSNLTVTVTNTSGKDIPAGSILKFTASFNSGAPSNQDYTLEAALAAGASKTITLTSIAVPTSTAGSVAITASFTMVGDANTSNNQKNKTVTINPAPTFTLPADIVSSKASETIAGPDGFTTYAWSTGEITKDITVTSSGTYTLKVTNAGGCSSEKSIKVIFKRGDIQFEYFGNSDKLCQSTTPEPVKIVVTNNGTTPILAGETLSVTGKINGVAFTETVTLAADIAPKANTELTLASTINVATGGKTVNLEATVTYQYDENKANDSGTKSFTVVASPTFSVGITTNSDRTEATLTASNQNLTYTWTTGATSRAITVYENASYSVTGTNTDGCSTTRTTVVDFLVPSTNNFLMVYPVEQATKCYEGDKKPFEVKVVNESMNTTVAAGTVVGIFATYTITGTTGKPSVSTFKGSTTLDAALAPQQSIVYRFDKKETNGSSVENMVEAAAGKHLVEGYTEVAGKKSIKKSTQFEILAPPAFSLGNGTIYRRLPTALKVDLPASDYTFRWSTGETTNSIIVSEEGEYSVTVTSKKGCTATGKVNVEEGKEVDEDKSIAIKKINLYPNPATTSVSIEVIADAPDTEVFVDIISSGGILMQTETATCNTAVTNPDTGLVDSYTTQPIRINTERLEVGTYVVLARTASKKLSKILIVNR